MKVYTVVLTEGKVADVLMDGHYIGLFAVDRICESGNNKPIVGDFSDDEDFAFKGSFFFSTNGMSTFFGTGILRIFDCRRMTTEQTNKVFMDVVAGRR